MSTSIVERIRAERSARAACREAILGGKTAPDASDDDGPAACSPPPAAGADEILDRMKDRIFPVLGKVVASEVSSSLDKARRSLIDCLEKELSAKEDRAEPSEERDRERDEESEQKADSPPAPEEVTPDRMETDLDLPVDEVNQQLDRVFAEMDPLSARPVVGLEPKPHPRQAAAARPKAADPLPPPAATPSSSPQGGAESADPASAWGLQCAPEKATSTARATPPSPPPAAADGIAQSIIDEIAGMLGAIEKAQEATAEEVEKLEIRVAGLEALARSPQEAPRPAATAVAPPPPAPVREDAVPPAAPCVDPAATRASAFDVVLRRLDSLETKVVGELRALLTLPIGGKG